MGGEVTREDIVAAIAAAAGEAALALALWEGGSAATGRLDALSDVDLQLVVEDGAAKQGFGLVEGALAGVTGVQHAWHVPEPTWHGYSQRFYRLRGVPEHLMVDLVVIERSRLDRTWLEPERHGRQVVLLDREELLTLVPFDAAAHRERMRTAFEDLRGKVPVIGHLAGKALARGQLVEAAATYRRLLLEPLVLLLGMRYRPLRFDFGMRYLESDLPAEWYAEVERLSLVGDARALEAAIARARSLVGELLAELDVDAIPLEELSAACRR